MESLEIQGAGPLPNQIIIKEGGSTLDEVYRGGNLSEAAIVPSVEPSVEEGEQ